MKASLAIALVFTFASALGAQTPEVKFIADTLVVAADGTYEADPDLAKMNFHIFAQEKDLKKAYQEATQSIERIATLAANNGLKKEDVSTGVLTVAPVYEGDRKKRARSYYVQGELVLRVHEFSKIAPILDGSVADGVADFRSLSYSLSDEEEAKKRAVAEAMRRAIGRASTALEQKGQRLGGLRYMSLDVKQLYGIAQLEDLPVDSEMAEQALRATRRALRLPRPLPRHSHKKSPSQRAWSAPSRSNESLGSRQCVSRADLLCLVVNDETPL